ncbi:MAG: anti-sigma factor domain-containing protein [Candidatus Fermentithermobacillus carboniphilus]|uniref:Anti-sigma factor domain-containing protein n=1 Tax=Candidatus Fermentithermobacillus carboniphilus TaxID=3085328 RepID=A0AAT9LDC2_9FIRM|nr:MAG: anti-sigma factor domain-containing protein [Candidatus Fermentithermobacillus carboniphilus]
MHRQRCLVVDIRGDKVTVLTPDGRFKNMSRQNLDLFVGEEVLVAEPEASKVFPSLFGKRLALAAALSLVIIISSFFSYTRYLEARPSLAYVTVDFVDSPGSIELEVNDKGLVKSARSFDEPGEKVLSATDVHLKPVEKVVAHVVRACGQKGVSGVLIGIVPIKESPAVNSLEKRVAEKARESLKELERARTQEAGTGVSATLNTLRLDLDIRKEAEKLNMSAARAAVWALAKKSGQGQEKEGNSGQVNITSDSGQGKPGKSVSVKSTLPSVDLEALLKAQSSENQKKYIEEITRAWVEEFKGTLEEQDEGGPEKPGQHEKPEGEKSRDQESKGESESGKRGPEGGNQKPADENDKGPRNPAGNRREENSRTEGQKGDRSEESQNEGPRHGNPGGGR